jgi:hypothetical protein
MSRFITSVVVAGIFVALCLGLSASPSTADHPPGPAPAAAGPHLDATSAAEAHQMRHVLIVLAGQTAAGARCDPGERADRYGPCAAPALRRAAMGGLMAANVLDAVIAGVPSGRCRAYLLGLRAASQAAGDQAHWLLPRLYGPDHRRAQREVATQLAQITVMLRRAANAMAVDVCAPRHARA